MFCVMFWLGFSLAFLSLSFFFPVGAVEKNPNLLPLNIYAYVDGSLEGDFWVSLFTSISRPTNLKQVHNDNEIPLANDTLLIGRTSFLEKVLPRYLSGGCTNFGIHEWADEKGTSRLIPLYQQLDFIFRNYYFRHIFSDVRFARKIGWIMNGPANGVRGEKPLRLASERRHLCFFGGSTRGDRKEMYAALHQIGNPCLMKIFPNFGGRISRSNYTALTCDSTFVLCPKGNSPETIRFYDALECGAIPVVLNSSYEYYHVLGPSPPLIFLNQWADFRLVVTHFHANPHAYDNFQRRAIAFYQLLQERTVTYIDAKISNAFHSHYHCTDC